MFDRDDEWDDLTRFAADDTPGATLAVVSGRRRQGKTLLLYSLAQATGGLYFAATEATEADALRRLGQVIADHVGAPAPLRLGSWEQGIDALLEIGRHRPTVAVLDEFPHLVLSSRALPSIIQHALTPGRPERTASRTRLLLCGSAMSFMGGMLSGTAPLRGRAGLELRVAPLVLAAVAEGNTTRGGIAGYIGRKATDLQHPLTVLEDAGLLARDTDPLRSGRSSYRITEPLVAFYQAIMRPAWTRLERRQGAQVWRSARRRFECALLGPHFEQLCRTWVAEFATPETLGGIPATVGHSVVNDAAARTSHEVDIVALGDPGAGPRPVLVLGETKWGEPIGLAHLDRLRRIRSLLQRRPGIDVSSTKRCSTPEPVVDRAPSSACWPGRSAASGSPASGIWWLAGTPTGTTPWTTSPWWPNGSRCCSCSTSSPN